MNLTTSMKQAGIVPAASQTVRRILVATEGADKSGKTNFALSAPGPIGYINLDIGLEGVVEKFMGKKQIFVKHCPVPPITELNNQVNQKKYLQIWHEVKKAHDAFRGEAGIRTIVWDTGTDAWELVRLAEFGQLAPGADIKRAYQPLNMLFKALIREMYEGDKNFVMIHKLKERYVAGKNNKGELVESWDGGYKRAGFKETGYLIQVNVEHFRDEEGFGVRIKDSRQNPWTSGMTFRDDEADFAHVASAILDGTRLEDWL